MPRIKRLKLKDLPKSEVSIEQLKKYYSDRKFSGSFAGPVNP